MAREWRGDDFAWFSDLMVDEAVWQEEDAGTRDEVGSASGLAEALEDVEGLLSKLLDEAGSVFQTYVEDDPNDEYERSERACARVANRAFAVALLVREERS